MNSTPQPLPGLGSLYRSDFTIKRAMHALAFGLLVAVGVQWASQPVAPANPPVEQMFEPAEVNMISAGGLVLSALGLIVLVWRYLRVKKILGQGAVIKGVVEDIEVFSQETGSDTQPIGKRARTYSYHATLRYTVNGVEKKVRLKLPNSGFTYGMAKGHETDLSVLESAPGKPLIRAVYLGRS